MPDTSEKPTVLIVDDEPSVRTVLERMAAFQGFTAVGATTAEEAFAAASRHAVVAFILDLNLKGGRSGLEVLAWLRQQADYTATPVFVLTGQLDVRDEERTVIRGYGARVFYKGLSMQSLFAELKSLLAEQKPD